MDARTYKLIELVGVSAHSYADATKNAIARAGETLKGLDWFEVTQRGRSNLGFQMAETLSPTAAAPHLARQG